MSIFNIVSLFGGLALFLYGMKLMSDGLKEGSTGTFKRIMEKVTNNMFKAFLLGLVVTALIQSSNATIVITSGLVAAGIITLKQSIGIIVGANVGTTITGQIIRLMDINSASSEWLQFFKPSTLAPFALIIGIVLIIFIKTSKTEVMGKIFMGFGILFTGLMNMTNSVSTLSSSNTFNEIFNLLSDSPFIGTLIGTIISIIIQSASASVAILQSFSVTGKLFFRSIYSVLIGIYMGTCLVTGLVCSIGAKADAKRVGVINILFNICKMIFIFVCIFIAKNLGLLNNIWDVSVNSGIIANTNTIFNLAGALVLFPLFNKFEEMSHLIVKDDDSSIDKYYSIISELDTKFYVTPALAFNSALNVLQTSFSTADKNINLSLDLLEKYDSKVFEEVYENEKVIDTLTDKLENYLVGLNGHISSKDHLSMMNQYHNLAIEFERLGDYAMNIAEYGKRLNETSKFTKDALKELSVLKTIINELLSLSNETFTKRDLESANKIEPLEEVVDDMVDALKDNHLKRLEKGKCNVTSGTIFLDLLNDIERISDICSNIGEATIARVLPEYTGKMHKYMAKLHQGKNDEFNKRYNAAHKKYFSLLKKKSK